MKIATVGLDLAKNVFQLHGIDADGRVVVRRRHSTSYDSRCFLPIHIYEATSGKPVAVILRPGKTPGGAEVALVLRHVVKAIRRRWPRVDILIRGDSHYARHEAMTWCEHNRVGYVFGLAGNQVLLGKVAALAEDAALGRVIGEGEKVRRFGEFRYAAKSWKVERRVIGRVEASSQGSDSRFVITNLAGTPRWLYESVYCARGQAENLIKAHKLHLASDRTSCTSATANQFRLLIHTAAYWLLHTLRGLAPKTSFWRDAQFDTIRLALIKVAARVTEMITRIKVALLARRLAKPALAIVDGSKGLDAALASPGTMCRCGAAPCIRIATCSRARRSTCMTRSRRTSTT